MDTQYDLLLAGGAVVAGSGMRRADVGVRGETVAAVGPHLPREHTCEVVDAAGKSLLGWPEMSLQRGRRVLWQNEIVAQPGQGRFLPTLGSHAEQPLKP